MKERFLNPFTDFGFKKLFGEEPNKDLLISLLNTLLPQKHQITDLEYTKNEYLGQTQVDRKAIFDLHCKNSQGEYFIVELQKAKQKFFKDRSVYYATFPVQAQAEQGTEWDFRLQAVYTVGILDFVFDNDDNDAVIHTVQLKNQQNQVFYDKLTFIYLTLPKFNKTLDQLVTLQDKWFYVFRHLQELEEIPSTLQEAVFAKLFKIAELANFDSLERQAYQDSVKYYRDLKNVIDSAVEEGKTTERLSIIKTMHRTGFTVEMIAKAVSLDKSEILQFLGESNSPPSTEDADE